MTTEFFRHKNGLYRVVEAGPWAAFEPVQADEVSDPRFRWQWEKIPLALVRQMTAFFEWSQKETGGETVVHLYYSEDAGEWAAVVLPQKGYTGLSVSLLGEHPGRIEAVEALGPGFELASTWHHHGGAPAFQSDTDRADEEDTFGLHVTVGHVGTAEYSLDARCSFRKMFTQAVLADWIAMPPENPRLPLKAREAVLLALVCEPAPETPFPDWWKDNVIKVEPPAVRGSLWQPYSKIGDYAHHFSPAKEPPGSKAEAPEPASLRAALQELCWWHRKEPQELADLIASDYQHDDLLLDLAKVMVDFDLGADGVERELRAQHQDQQLAE